MGSTRLDVLLENLIKEAMMKDTPILTGITLYHAIRALYPGAQPPGQRPELLRRRGAAEVFAHAKLPEYPASQ
ncbi:MAG: hypothetical protein U5P41_15520 [Gammaproteobacteria bacterium]|nr:hypothetical protein [Gammaproteobacteria bacterium]